MCSLTIALHACQLNYKQTYKSETLKYDQLAMKYLSYVLYPLSLGFSVYSLMYKYVLRTRLSPKGSTDRQTDRQTDSLSPTCSRAHALSYALASSPTHLLACSQVPRVHSLS